MPCYAGSTPQEVPLNAVQLRSPETKPGGIATPDEMVGNQTGLLPEVTANKHWHGHHTHSA